MSKLADGQFDRYSCGKKGALQLFLRKLVVVEGSRSRSGEVEEEEGWLGSWSDSRSPKEGLVTNAKLHACFVLGKRLQRSDKRLSPGVSSLFIRSDHHY